MEENTQQAVRTGKGKKIGCWIAGCLTVLISVVLFVTGVIGVAFWATKGLVKVVQEQLVYLKRGDIESAYLLTSGDFRKATSLEQFRYFILSNPSLSQNRSASFTSRKVENGRGYLEGVLTAIDGSKTPIKYELIKENGVWKILYMEISARGIESRSEKGADLSITTIEKIEVGTQRNPDGTIKDPRDRFPFGVGDIKVSVYISNAKRGQRVSAVWYFGQEAICNPVVNEIEEDGNCISQFYITPPVNGWPTGRYMVVISIDNEITKQVSYSIGL